MTAGTPGRGDDLVDEDIGRGLRLDRIVLTAQTAESDDDRKTSAGESPSQSRGDLFVTAVARVPQPYRKSAERRANQ